MERAGVASPRKPRESGPNGVATYGTGFVLFCSQRFFHSVRERIMKRRAANPLLAVATLALLTAPLVTRADAIEQAMDACVQAFVTANLTKGQRVVVEKQHLASGPLDAHSRTYKLVL